MSRVLRNWCPLDAIRDAARGFARARSSLPKLERDQISGDGATLGDWASGAQASAAKVMPPLNPRTSTTRANRASGAKKPSFPARAGLAKLADFLGYSAHSTRSEIPLVVLPACAAGHVRRAHLTFLNSAGPPVHDSADERLDERRSTSTPKSGLVTLFGFYCQERHPLDRRFATFRKKKEKKKQARSHTSSLQRSALTLLRPILMTTSATVFGHFPLTLVAGPERPSRATRSHRAGRRHDHRHAFRLLRPSVTHTCSSPKTTGHGATPPPLPHPQPIRHDLPRSPLQAQL